MIDTRLTTRDDFDPVYVMTLVLEQAISRAEAYRILTEACHLIVRLRDQQEQIAAWEKAAPWRQR